MTTTTTNKQTNNILRAGLPIGWQLKNYLFTAEKDYLIKVAFIQKGLMRLSFLQTGKPNYFPELKF